MEHLIGANSDDSFFITKLTKSPKYANLGSAQPITQLGQRDSRFAFLIHPHETSDYVKFDPSLKMFSEEQIVQLKKRMVDFLEPFSVGTALIESRTGQKAYGEFIMVPYTAQELVELPYERARAEIASAVEVAKKRGANIVGLGGFTSIATQGGLALRTPDTNSSASPTFLHRVRGLHQPWLQKWLNALPAMLPPGTGSEFP
jgi:predicted amino acid dehydrogenase